ncbi:hypothetical protein [Acinetobacter sp. CFCC 11171]|uniref:hypothetical protein n=1 Tax=Acinetobacter sp. CFCC 11171 TaxID=1775558 RepID=UPI000DCFC000|nr:hypothetical protein [Acinetobacter sp. CFCC 11171]
MNVSILLFNKVEALDATGISSGINASLYIVAKLHGLEIAKQTAKRMEYDVEFVEAIVETE